MENVFVCVCMCVCVCVCFQQKGLFILKRHTSATLSLSLLLAGPSLSLSLLLAGQTFYATC